MDPLSISASVLTVVAAAITTAKSLNETVGRYRGRDKLLGRLQGGLDDLINILKTLKEVVDGENPVLALLKGPVGRCGQLSREFEDAMKGFNNKSKPGLKDWTKMEFMRGDINEFIDTLAEYKSTITIGLGTITMNASRLTQQVVGDYNEMVKDTAYNLEIRLQRIDERLTSLAECHSTILDHSSIDLQDEKAVTIQCLRICERASSYIKSLQDGQSTLQREGAQRDAGYVLKQFEAQLLTQKTLNENRDSLIETIGRLREHLESAALNGDPEREGEKLWLQEEINFSKQCLDVCKEASSQVSTQKIHIIGEVVAEGDCDQVVVTALADLFNVGIVKATGRSMQMVGSMPADTIREMSKDRYGSRFGALGSSLAAAQMDTVDVSPSAFETPKPDPGHQLKSKQNSEDGNLPRSKMPSSSKPSSNEVKKRRAGVEDATK